MSKLLSVVIPIYNTSLYLKRCLDSIINQSYKELEIICVDDGSTDESGDIVDEYALKEPRIVVIHKENGGLVSARKAGIRVSTGKYITYVDSDDWVEPDMYQDLMLLAEKHQADVVTSGFIRDYSGKMMQDFETMPEGEYSEEKLDREIKHGMIDMDSPFKFALSPSLCNKIYEAELLKKHQLPIPEEITIDEDTVCTVPLFLDAKSVYVSGRNYYHYCKRDTSMLNDKKSYEYGKIERAYQYLRGKVPEDICNYCETYAYLQMCPEKVLKYENGILKYFGVISKSDRVLVYGAGTFGRALYEYLKSNGFNVVAWADKNGDGDKIIKQEQIQDVEYDVLLIGVLISGLIDSIWKQLDDLNAYNKYRFSFEVL